LITLVSISCRWARWQICHQSRTNIQPSNIATFKLYIPFYVNTMLCMVYVIMDKIEQNSIKYGKFKTAFLITWINYYAYELWNSIISILLFCFTSCSRIWVLCNYCLFKHIRLSIVNVPIKSVVLFLFFQPVEIQLCIDNQSRQYFPVKEVELAHIYIHTHLHMAVSFILINQSLQRLFSVKKVNDTNTYWMILWFTGTMRAEGGRNT
jgi:hypothetical protein